MYKNKLSGFKKLCCTISDYSKGILPRHTTHFGLNITFESGAMVYWLSARTHNAGVVTLNPKCAPITKL